jgi:hypothetical protein
VIVRERRRPATFGVAAALVSSIDVEHNQ